MVKYDYNGLRLRKGDRKYYWQGNTLKSEGWEKDGKEHYIYYYYDESGVSGMNYNGVDYYYRKNVLGDVIAIYDTDGNRICQYYYSAFGEYEILGDSTIGELNPFRYRGYYYDTETGLYYLQSRYYDPEVGRFISADDVSYLAPDKIFGLNLYAYCVNNPVMYTDPSGTELQWWHKLLIGVGFIVAGAVVTALTAGAGTGFFAALGSALLSSAIQVGISTAISAGIGLVTGGISTGTWQGALDGLFNGAVDGFMWGGIFSGGAQILSGGFKIAANLGATTGRHGGIQLAQNLKILSPNNAGFYENGGTLLKIGKNFRIDVGSKTMLHMHMLGAEHVPLGTVLSTVFGSYNSLCK